MKTFTPDVAPCRFGVRHWKAQCGEESQAAFGEGPTEKGCSCSTSPAAYSTLRGEEDSNAFLLPERSHDNPLGEHDDEFDRADRLIRARPPPHVPASGPAHVTMRVRSISGRGSDESDTSADGLRSSLALICRGHISAPVCELSI